MHRTLIAVLAACTVASCSRAAQREVAAPTAAEVVLRLLDITPPDGARVDSGTVLVARLAYHIPDFDADRTYVVSALFAGEQGGLFNRGSGDTPLRASHGIVTIRHPMEALWSGAQQKPASPLTGVFFLLDIDPLPTVQGTIAVGDSRRIGTAMIRSSVRGQSRTFYYNGNGPARSLAAGLPDLLEEYWTYRPHKALAVAYGSASRWTYGYGYGFRTREDAVERALEECRAAAERRGIETPCRLIDADEQGGEL